MAMNMQIAYHYRMLNLDATFSSVFNNLPLSRSIIRRAIQQTLWVERNGMLGELTWKKIKNIIKHWDQAFWNSFASCWEDGCNTFTVHFRGDIFDADTGRREYSFKRTIKYDSHMLDKPDFVGSYEVGDHVYFFFREMAVEYMNCGRAVYSRFLLYHPISGLILNVPILTNTQFSLFWILSFTGLPEFARGTLVGRTSWLRTGPPTWRSG